MCYANRCLSLGFVVSDVVWPSHDIFGYPVKPTKQEETYLIDLCAEINDEGKD